MSSSVQAKKWREQNPNYSKNWYHSVVVVNTDSIKTLCGLKMKNYKN